jgi:hypothetical protein
LEGSMRLRNVPSRYDVRVIVGNWTSHQESSSLGGAALMVPDEEAIFPCVPGSTGSSAVSFSRSACLNHLDQMRMSAEQYRRIAATTNRWPSVHPMKRWCASGDGWCQGCVRLGGVGLCCQFRGKRSPIRFCRGSRTRGRTSASQGSWIDEVGGGDEMLSAASPSASLKTGKGQVARA